MSGRREGAPAPSSRELARLCHRVRRRTATSQEQAILNRARSRRSDQTSRSVVLTLSNAPVWSVSADACNNGRARRKPGPLSDRRERIPQSRARVLAPGSRVSVSAPGKSSKRSRSPEPGAGSPKSSKRSQSPEPSTSSSQASRHPPNRRPRPPAHKAEPALPSSGYSRYRQPRRGSLFWHRTRWLAARLIVIATLVTAGVIGYHWYSGAPLEAAVEMMAEDYRLAAACPTESETVFDFLGRAPYPDNDSRMSVRYPDGWEAQVCNGDLAFDQSTDIGEADQSAQTMAPIATEVPAPDAQTTATPKPTIRPTVEAPIRRIVAIPRPTLPPTYAPIPPPMLPPAATAIPAITLKLPSSPIVALLPTIAAVPTVALLPTVAPTPAPLPPPPLRRMEEKLFMLELINDERVSAGLNPVVLGDNAAAQLHRRGVA